MTKWTLGPKFSAYLGLIFMLMSTLYGMELCITLLYGTLYTRSYDRDLSQYLWLFLLLCLAAFISHAPYMFRQSLSEDSAMFFTSIPVTSFETVMAKQLAVTAGVLIPFIVLGSLLFVGFSFSEEKWRIFVNLMWGLGFTRQNMTAGLLLIIWLTVIVGFVMGGISLLAFFLGDHFSGSRKKLLMWVLILFFEAVLLAAAAGLLLLIWLVGVLPVLVRLLLIMAAAIVLSVVLVRLNLVALEKWYCI